MFRLLESGPTKQQLWELPTSRPEFGNSQFGVRGFVITGLIRQVEENLELREELSITFGLEQALSVKL